MVWVLVLAVVATTGAAFAVALAITRRRASFPIVPGRFQAAVGSSWSLGEANTSGGRQGWPEHDFEPTIATDQVPRTGAPESRSWRGDVVGDAATAGFLGAVSLADWWHVDDTVLGALSHVSGEHIDSVTDLWHLVHDHSYQLSNGWLDALHGHIGEGLFVSLRGHVGEQMVAHDLTQAGLHVDWPAAGNQPGWDLNADGHLVNVKVTADAGRTAAEHFSQHPDIPVIVNGDAGDIPHTAIHFDPTHGLDPTMLTGDHVLVVDDALSAHAAMGAVQDAFGADAIHGALTDAHLPVLTVVVTAARSGWREEQLRRSGQTTAARAAKNIAIDTGARTVGVLAGLKAGAVAGLIVDASTGGVTMGLGTVVGAFLGAFGGGVGGSMAARKLRLQPLKRAQENAREALVAYDAATSQVLSEGQDAYRTAEARARLALAIRAHLAKQELAAGMERERAELRAQLRLNQDAVITEALTQSALVIPGPRVGAGRLVPGRLRDRAYRHALGEWERAMRCHAIRANDDPERLAAFWDTVAATPAGRAVMHSWVDGIQRKRTAAYARCISAAYQTSAALEANRVQCRASVLRVAADQVDRGRKRLDPLARTVASTHEAFMNELRAAGMTPETSEDAH